MKKNKKIEKDKKLNMRSDKIEKVTIIFESKNVYRKVKTNDRIYPEGRSTQGRPGTRPKRKR